MPSVQSKPRLPAQHRSVEIERGSGVRGVESNSQIDCPVTNVYDCLLRGIRCSGRDGRCLGWRVGDHYDWLSFGQVRSMSTQLAIQLRSRIGLEKQQCVGIYAATTPKWALAAMACACSSLVVVPLYDTLGAAACNSIIEETQLSVVFVDSLAAAQRLVQLESSSVYLKTVIVFNENQETLPPSLECSRLVQVIDFEELTAPTPTAAATTTTTTMDDTASASSKDSPDWPLPSPSDLYMIQYTSGTTGKPKGVMLSHSNVAANVNAIMTFLRDEKRRDVFQAGQDTGLLFLPLAHSYGQTVLLCVMHCGCATGFYSGNTLKISEDAQVLRPTFVPLVPRVMNKVYAKVLAEVEKVGGIKAKLFQLAYTRKKAMLEEQGTVSRSTIWDRVVFRKIQAKLGGKVRIMMTTSAPIADRVLEFWRIVFGAFVLEVYGQTESTAMVTASTDQRVGGTVGHAIACNRLKLVDVPELGYLASKRQGEVCVSGTNVTKGYFMEPEKTAEALDRDGWLHTGDIGELLPNGALKLIDRKKHIFKLSQGEYIAPEKIEAIYAGCPLIAQIFVDGSALEWFTIAIVVPDTVEAEAWAKQQNIPFTNLADLTLLSDFKMTIYKALINQGVKGGLSKLEQIRNLCLHSELFSIENDLMTPSMKNRRPQIRAKFKAELDQLYADGPIAADKN